MPITNPRLLFLMIAVAVCSLLSLRPIPDVTADNDTGRYIETFHEVCNMPVSFDWTNRVTLETYNLFVKPTCMVESNFSYMFLFAMPVPFALFIFGAWGRGSLLIACSFLLSFTCFEFMTNALRQSASVFFLLGAFAYIGRPKLQIFYGVIALLLHDSSVAFIPLLFLLNYVSSNDIRLRTVLGYLLLSVGVFGVALVSLNTVYLGGEGDLIDLYNIFQKKYEDGPTVWFQLFVVLPAFWVFAIRWLDNKASVSLDEKIVIAYSALIFAVTILFFSYITYRFAMTAVTIQLFLAMRDNKTPFRTPVWLSVGLVLHMLVYAAFSKNVALVLFG